MSSMMYILIVFLNFLLWPFDIVSVSFFVSIIISAYFSEVVHDACDNDNIKFYYACHILHYMVFYASGALMWLLMGSLLKNIHFHP